MTWDDIWIIYLNAWIGEVIQLVVNASEDEVENPLDLEVPISFFPVLAGLVITKSTSLYPGLILASKLSSLEGQADFKLDSSTQP